MSSAKEDRRITGASMWRVRRVSREVSSAGQHVYLYEEEM